MDDDNKPIDASIRPVLPSRACSAETFMENRPLPPPPMFDEPTQLPKPRRRTTRKTRHPLPPQPERKTAVKKRPKDKKRSAIAKAAWQTRRKNAGKSPLLAAPYGVEGEHFAAAISAMMKLKPAQRTLVMQILQSLTP